MRLEVQRYQYEMKIREQKNLNCLAFFPTYSRYCFILYALCMYWLDSCSSCNHLIQKSLIYDSTYIFVKQYTYVACKAYMVFLLFLVIWSTLKVISNNYCYYLSHGKANCTHTIVSLWFLNEKVTFFTYMKTGILKSLHWVNINLL